MSFSKMMIKQENISFVSWDMIFVLLICSVLYVIMIYMANHTLLFWVCSMSLYQPIKESGRGEK